MAKPLLGVDIGGTKSHALLADETGQALGFGAVRMEGAFHDS